MAIKKLIATTVRSRERGVKRREEARTTSSHLETATQGNHQSNRSTSEGRGRDKLKKVDGDFPACMRLKKKKKKKDSSDDHKEKRRPERKKRRTQTLHVDGDVPLCLRKTEGKSKDGRSSKNKEQRRKKQNGERKQRFVRRFDNIEK